MKSGLRRRSAKRERDCSLRPETGGTPRHRASSRASSQRQTRAIRARVAASIASAEAVNARSDRVIGSRFCLRTQFKGLQIRVLNLRHERLCAR